MLSRVLIGVLGAAAVVCVSGIAAAEPPPVPAPQPPPPPNVNALAPVKLSEYAVMENNWYAFSTPDGLTCVAASCFSPLSERRRGLLCHRRAGRYWR